LPDQAADEFPLPFDGSNVLRWSELKAAAEAAFDVWVSGGELQWAKDVWERAVAAGIANYSNEIERHRLLILFLGLAGLYRDFCFLAWDDQDPPARIHSPHLLMSRSTPKSAPLSNQDPEMQLPELPEYAGYRGWQIVEEFTGEGCHAEGITTGLESIDVRPLPQERAFGSVRKIDYEQF
jgi:hypothetical protein